VLSRTAGPEGPPETSQKRGREGAGTAFFLLTSGIAATLLAILAAEIKLHLVTVDSGHALRTAAGRLARMAFFLGFVAACALVARKRRPPLLRACGLAPVDRPARSYGVGFVAGVIPVLLVIGLLLAVGARTFELRGSAGTLAWTCTKYLLLGFPLVLLEEGLFRGLLLGDFVRAIGARAAIVVTSFFFAITHFLGTTDAWRGTPGPIQSGVDVMFAVFGGLPRAWAEWPELVGLFLAGVVLSIVRLRTGHVWVGMGIHAGWYWIKQVDRNFVRDVEEVVVPNQFWLGSEQYLDGLLGWAALVATLFVALRIEVRGEASPRVAGVLRRGIEP
jgi:uncharacterized protein